MISTLTRVGASTAVADIHGLDILTYRRTKDTKGKR